MFAAALSKRSSGELQKSRKMKEIEARAKSKFRKTADDPERIKRLLLLRTKEGQSQNKQFLKNRMARSVMSDQKSAASFAIRQKKLRSKKILYGETGEEVEYHPGDEVRLSGWLEFHTQHKYNGSVGIIVEKFNEGNANDVNLRDLKTHRVFTKYSVRVPVIQPKETFQTMIDSSLYQKVDTHTTIVVNEDKITLIKAASGYFSPPSNATKWQMQMEGYLDEDDTVDPKTGELARARAKQRIEEAKQKNIMSKNADKKSVILTAQNKADIAHAKAMKEWKVKDKKFHAKNQTCSTFLTLWNEQHGAPAQPVKQKFQTMTVKHGTTSQESSSKGRRIERREDPTSGGFYTRREFVDYYGDLTIWSRAKSTAIFEPR